jgi:hypothetical protein
MFLDGAPEPFVTGVMISLSDNQLFSFLATFEAPYTAEHSGVQVFSPRKMQITDKEYPIV